MEYRIIATDLDGTLLTDDKKICARNKEAIIKAQEKGVKVVLASGRPTFAMLDIAKELELDKYEGYIMAYNGGEIIDYKTKEVVYSQGVAKDEIIAMYNYANENGIYFLTYNDDVIYANQINKYTLEEVVCTNGQIKEIEDIHSLDFSKTVKCMLLSEEHILKEHEKLLKNSKYAEKLGFFISNVYFLEVVNKEVDKGQSLIRLADILNIDIKESIAAGDSYNDIPLLEVSGLKVAPSNAKDEIKNMVDYIGVSNNEGILGDLIEKYVLN